MSSQAQTPTGAQSGERLIELITPLIAPLGYEIVHLETQTHRQKILRIFIDLIEPEPGRRIGIEDCARVSRELDEPLEKMTEIEAIFHGPYELEVSSPGIDRPLRQRKDYERFSGREIRVHVYRPLTAEELNNGKYQNKNPKQKNFLGVLKGLENDRIVLAISASGASSNKGSKKKRKEEHNAGAAEEETVTIPFPLISKANLEPKFENFNEDERE